MMNYHFVQLLKLMSSKLELQFGLNRHALFLKSSNQDITLAMSITSCFATVVGKSCCVIAYREVNNISSQILTFSQIITAKCIRIYKVSIISTQILIKIRLEIIFVKNLTTKLKSLFVSVCLIKLCSLLF